LQAASRAPLNTTLGPLGHAPVELSSAAAIHQPYPQSASCAAVRRSVHAADEMEDDGFTILDLENIILTGVIVERQKDRKTDETKIVIRGIALDSREAEVVVKVGLSGVLYIITVYAT
jgi:hypothetical protein